MRITERTGLERLFHALRDDGYTLVGPTIRDQAVIYDEIESIDDLPAGWTDHQDAGTYRLERRNDDRLFGYTLAVQSWKRFLFPPAERLFGVERHDGNPQLIPEGPVDERFAFIGVRACELHAIEIQDRVFLSGTSIDPQYKSRRERAFIVAVHCAEAADTCFCQSMGTGPMVNRGFDLALTELVDHNSHRFLVQAGSRSGERVLDRLAFDQADEDEVVRGEMQTANALSQSRHMPRTVELRELLQPNLEHRHWESIASRCLSCANCTMVCPTCFCSTVEDTTDLTGDHAERWRKWDSCFTLDFSHIAGGSIRQSTKSRYRQWLTHKLCNWHDQFGVSGCVGCGRCITWCPVGIDLTAEIAAMQADCHAPAPSQTPREGE